MEVAEHWNSSVTAAQGAVASLSSPTSQLAVSLCHLLWVGGSVWTIPGVPSNSSSSGILCCLGWCRKPGKSTHLTPKAQTNLTQWQNSQMFHVFWLSLMRTTHVKSPHLLPLQEPSHHFHHPPSLLSFTHMQDSPPFTLEIPADFLPLLELLAHNNYCKLCTETAVLQSMNKPFNLHLIQEELLGENQLPIFIQTDVEGWENSKITAALPHYSLRDVIPEHCWLCSAENGWTNPKPAVNNWVLKQSSQN